MTENESIEALKLEGGIEIKGNPGRIAKFFEALDMAGDVPCKRSF